MQRRLAVVLLASLSTAWYAPSVGAQSNRSSGFLYLWTASADTTQPDFLAILDSRPNSKTYGGLVETLPVPGLKNGPHHTEYEMPADGQLFANGFESGQTFIFDVRSFHPPRYDRKFGDRAGMMHPHSFVRLPNGNVLATFQMQKDSIGMAPGGLVEMTQHGRLVRSSSADAPSIDRRIRPYSAAVVKSLDRIVTTTTDMDGDAQVPAMQLWRLSDLKLLSTFNLPNGPRGDEGALTAEPRLLKDKTSVLVSTFNCGLYLMHGLDTESPSGELVASFPRKDGTYCAVPVVAGDYYLITVPAWSAVVSLDISNPSKPREVSRLTLGAGDVPHWIAIEPNLRRVVITGYGTMSSRVMMANFDPKTGQLSLDERFRDPGATEPGVRMDNKTWPHDSKAVGIPHGAVFSRP